MTSQWLESLSASGFDVDPQSAGDARADARRAASETVIAPLAHLGLIRAEGADAAPFLHNLLTNDVSGLAETDMRRAGFCTPKGRMLADFLLWRDSAGVTLQLSADMLPAMLKKLSMYVLRSKVKLSDISADFARMGIAGPQATALLQRQSLPSPEPMHITAFEDGVVLGLDAHRYEVVIATINAGELWQALLPDAAPVGTNAWVGLDIAAGIPLITVPTSEAFIPQMVNFERIGGVGFKKGCYPGQEIVARTQYLGKIKRRMYRAHLDGDGLANPGTSLYSPETADQSCGNVVLSAPAAAGGIDMLVVAQSSAVAAGLHIGEPAGPKLNLLTLPYAVE